VDLRLALIIFGALALIALISADGRWRWLFLFAKPATTLSLLLITGFPSQDRFGVLVVGALLLSVLGDTALLYESAGFFIAGLLLFLLAQAAFTSAFLLGGGRGPFDPIALVGFAVVALSSLWLLRRLWPRIEQRLRGPVLLYGVAITLMVGAAYILLGGPWPFYVTVPITAGAVSFYLGDAILAWGRFRQPLPMQQTMNLAFYWTGQLGIALGAHYVASGG
jgi:uncharacterized membrane protein YhhN